MASLDPVRTQPFDNECESTSVLALLGVEREHGHRETVVYPAIQNVIGTIASIPYSAFNIVRSFLGAQDAVGAVRDSMALRLLANALAKERLPIVPSTPDSTNPLRFLPSRMMTTSTSVFPSGRRVRV